VIERRYECLHPAEMRAAVAEAPIAFLPIGTLEFHGEHLPFGVDSFEAHGLCMRAAELAGGVVLPPVYLACGCLDLPFTLSFERDLVHDWVSATLDQLALRGFTAVVVLTGHGPLDLNHLLKRACAEAEERSGALAAYALCWLELNAAGLAAPETAEPTCVDHAARVETSWMLALEPGLVHTDRLADDPDAANPGVYGRNPRFTASAEFGASQISAAAELLAARARGLLIGMRPDPLADLRRFVRYAWPEPPSLRGRAGAPAQLLISNPGRSSRYLSALGVSIDGASVDPGTLLLVNASPGESGAQLRASELGPERGFYLRRGQEATITLGTAPVRAGMHRVQAELGLAGVTSLVLDADVDFAG
jgi:creatinine amidohydrolase